MRSAVQRRMREVAEVRTGFLPQTARTPEATAGREWHALRVGDVAADGRIAWAALGRVVAPTAAATAVVRDGDVLVPLRSPRPTATVARGVSRDVVAVGHWALCTADPGSVLPEYMAWFLNHPRLGAGLEGALQGSNLKFLPMRAVRDLRLDVPPLSVQRRIVGAVALNTHAAALERELAAARAQLVDAVTLDALRRTGAAAP